MNRIIYFTVLFGLIFFVEKAHSSHIEETGMDEAEAERRRTYCVRVARVSKRDTFEVRPVHCQPGFEFCFTSTTCCCEQIPEKHMSLPLSIGVSVGGIFLTAIFFLLCCLCMRSSRAHPPSEFTHSEDLRSTRKRPTSEVNSVHNYMPNYGGPPPSSFYGDPSEKYGAPSTAYGYAPGGVEHGERLDDFDVGKVGPFSVSGSLPPPPYSEHSFNVGQAVLYKPGRDVSTHIYSKRLSRPSSVISWLKTQDGARPQTHRSSSGSLGSVVRNSRSVSRASSVVNQSFEPEAEQHDMMKIPSVRSSSGSTMAASEVIYNTVGDRSQAESQRGAQSIAGASSLGRHSVSASNVRKA